VLLLLRISAHVNWWISPNAGKNTTSTVMENRASFSEMNLPIGYQPQAVVSRCRTWEQVYNYPQTLELLIDFGSFHAVNVKSC